MERIDRRDEKWQVQANSVWEPKGQAMIYIGALWLFVALHYLWTSVISRMTPQNIPLQNKSALNDEYKKDS